MLFLVDVTPKTGEPATLTASRADAGRDWLHKHAADGTLVGAWAYPETGGLMIVDVADAVQLGELLATYPLRSTVRLHTRPLVTIDEGFDFLATSIASESAAAAARQDGRDAG